MKLEFDTLKCVKIIQNTGISDNYAEILVSNLLEFEFSNLYSKKEVDKMLSETVEKVFRDHQVELDRRLEAEGRALDQRLRLTAEHYASDLAEARNQRRWMVGTIITCTFALAGYLSALIHFTH